MTERRFVVLIVLAVLILSLIGILIANAVINSRSTVNKNPNPSYVVDNQTNKINKSEGTLFSVPLLFYILYNSSAGSTGFSPKGYTCKPF